MRGLLPSVWLLGAALYTASILSLTRPFADDESWLAPPPVTETVVAKLPPAVTVQALGHEQAPLVLAALTPRPKAEHPTEWVQVAGYTTVVRARPSAESPPLYAYAVGRSLRVIAREGHFARVQDLGSGKLGWIEESSLVPFFGGYRKQRTPRVAEPLVAAVSPAPATVQPEAAAPVPTAELLVRPVAAAKKAKPPRGDVIAARVAKETVTEAAPVERGLFRRKRGVQRVALGGRGSGMAGMIDRAIRGF
ncbi:MAG TPA: hypothetical protein VLB11_08250 [Methyloceanibacter sp.]|nr:hypothetical protein [Methyloceanibacter sp.]